MLPDPVYRALPYLYILTGVVCPVVFESEIIYVSSVLLVFTGFMVFWMRYGGGARYRTEAHSEHGTTAARRSSTAGYSKPERRHLKGKREFPLINNNGEIIAYDRRMG